MNDRSPFDHGDRQAGDRDKSAQYILIGMGIVGVILFLVVVSPFGIFGGGGDDGGVPGTLPSGSVADGRAPGVPDGFEALSIHFNDLEQPPNTQGPYALTMPLLQTITDGRNLGLYTFTDGRWQRLSSATLVNNGNAASGEVGEMPANLAVLRLLASAVQVTGWLPAGAQPDPDALSAVTTINPVDYGPIADGGIEGAARALPEVNGNVVPTVRSATPEQDSAVNAILASPALRDEHITSLVQLSLQPGYAGIDIDYARINPARKADFTSFITVLADQLHQANRTISVTLPTPARAGVSWDTGAYDWEEIAARVDLIKLSSEADPSVFHPVMTGVLDFLQGSVDLKKVALVVGRQSYEKATDGLTALTLFQALSLASEIEIRTASQITPNSSVVIVGRNIFQDDGASGLHWDPDALAVAFDYPGRGGTRTVYLENSLSLAFKLALAQRYNLAGVAVGDISDTQGMADYWEPLRTYAESGEVTPVQPNSVLLRPMWDVQAGTSQAENKGNLVWTAPAQPGAYDVSLIISDGVIRVSQKQILQVQAPAPQ